jgi:hypothetical protein
MSTSLTNLDVAGGRQPVLTPASGTKPMLRRAKTIDTPSCPTGSDIDPELAAVLRMRKKIEDEQLGTRRTTAARTAGSGVPRG